MLHVVLNTVRYASRRYWHDLARDLAVVCTAVHAEIAAVRFGEPVNPKRQSRWRRPRRREQAGRRPPWRHQRA